MDSWAVGYYVVDEVGSAGIIAGPFTTPSGAQEDQRERDIADDCGVWHRDSNGQFTPTPATASTQHDR